MALKYLDMGVSRLALGILVAFVILEKPKKVLMYLVR